MGERQVSAREAGRVDRRLMRIITCLRMLERRCYSVTDLARHFDVSKRTVYRDLRLLARAGVPLVRHTREGCYCIAEPGAESAQLTGVGRDANWRQQPP